MNIHIRTLLNNLKARIIILNESYIYAIIVISILFLFHYYNAFI